VDLTKRKWQEDGEGHRVRGLMICYSTLGIIRMCRLR
jgi:hypothetical protein